MDIIPETINRLRLSDEEIVLLHRILKKLDSSLLDADEEKLHRILIGRLEGRLKLKEQNPDL